MLWQSATEDESSGSTGSSVFDFNGDGVAEVVYRDECWLRVYSGPDGSKRFAAPVTSGTVQEEPVIADVDGDGHAEIVAGSDSAQNNRCKGSRSSVELGIKHPGRASACASTKIRRIAGCPRVASGISTPITSPT